MKLTNTVVVGMDGSDPARTAAEWAADWAADRDRPLILLAVHGTVASERRATDSAWHWPDAAGRKQQVEVVLDQQIEHLKERHPDLQIDRLVLTADPVDALVRASRDALMVVIGTRRLGGITGKVLGSVADAAVARAEGPIVVVPPGYQAAPGPIMIGFDLAAPPLEAARFAFAAAQESGRKLVVATVEDPVRPLELIAPVQPVSLLPSHDLALRRQQVEKALADLRVEFPDVECEVTVVPGLTARSLVALGSEAELLVVGTRGRSELLGLLFGSVSRTVLRETETPAVVVPEHTFAD
ncbi:universal stress protein [Granulicoccus sp. GXG6511]|uniref:universal stress protein n=1 Tax=Granulicoccus sp. GXG6511 TaxID=3381351 RepID=UPI003D7DBDB3